jgi:four helix bundle protein
MKIYEIALIIVRSVFRLARRVAEKDRDLARQMTRACSSVPLNMQEGIGSRGGNRIARFHDAMGSARETMACLHVCVAAGYLQESQVAEDLDRLDHVVAALYRLCHKRRA